jgi:hypothetical protein
MKLRDEICLAGVARDGAACRPADPARAAARARRRCRSRCCSRQSGYWASHPRTGGRWPGPQPRWACDDPVRRGHHIHRDVASGQQRRPALCRCTNEMRPPRSRGQLLPGPGRRPTLVITLDTRMLAWRPSTWTRPTAAFSAHGIQNYLLRPGVCPPRTPADIVKRWRWALTRMIGRVTPRSRARRRGGSGTCCAACATTRLTGLGWPGSPAGICPGRARRPLTGQRQG